MSTTHCGAGGASQRVQQMSSYRPHGGLKCPLTSSSDSLCGTEKQLVTSTECLSTVPVREYCPCVIKPWAPNCPKCFQEVSSKSGKQKPKLGSEAPSSAMSTNGTRIFQRNETLEQSPTLFLNCQQTGSVLTLQGLLLPVCHFLLPALLQIFTL